MAGKRKETDKELLQALAYGATVEAAALKANISERTAYRRLKDPAFRQQLEEKKAEIVRRTSTMLNGLALESVRTLVELQGTAHPPAVRLGATKAAIALAIKLRETTELAERLAAIEQRLKGIG